MSVTSAKRSSRNSLMVVACSAAVTLAACSKPEEKAPQAAEPAMVSTALEGQLDIVAWPGYIERGESDKAYDWVTQFEANTGCKVNVKVANTSDEMVTLMSSGAPPPSPPGDASWPPAGNAPYDLVTASGDASLRLIRGGTVQPIGLDRIKSFETVDPRLREAAWHFVDGKHWGVPYQWGPNVLLYNTKVFKKAPTSWSVVFEEQKLPDGKSNKNRVQAYDGPIYIADAALYLASKKPDLGIKDPYELNPTQFNAAISLLKKQKPLIKKYWALASDEIDLFKNGDAVVGASWPYQTNTLIAAKAPVKDLVPKEGATGWLDTWMVSAKTKNLDCAYKWLAWISTPKVQAQQAIYFGETPVNSKACAWMDKLSKGSCAQYHANAPLAYFKQIYFWKTPIASPPRSCARARRGWPGRSTPRRAS